jgi:hypothetical protein
MDTNDVFWTDSSVPSRTDLKRVAAGMRVGDRLVLSGSISGTIPKLDLLLAGFSKPDSSGVCVKRVSDTDADDGEAPALVNEDSLLRDSDIIKKSSVIDCGSSSASADLPKKRACANCTCGLADSSPSSGAEPKTSSCGSVSC